MRVYQFIEWLKTQDQNLWVNVVEHSTYWDYQWNGEDEVGVEITHVQAVCFDDVERQSKTTEHSLILGVEQ